VAAAALPAAAGLCETASWEHVGALRRQRGTAPEAGSRARGGTATPQQFVVAFRWGGGEGRGNEGRCTQGGEAPTRDPSVHGLPVRCVGPRTSASSQRRRN